MKRPHLAAAALAGTLSLVGLADGAPARAAAGSDLPSPVRLAAVRDYIK